MRREFVNLVEDTIEKNEVPQGTILIFPGDKAQALNVVLGKEGKNYVLYQVMLRKTPNGDKLSQHSQTLLDVDAVEKYAPQNKTTIDKLSGVGVKLLKKAIQLYNVGRLPQIIQ
jgi:hypothetical protein